MKQVLYLILIVCSACLYKQATGQPYPTNLPNGISTPAGDTATIRPPKNYHEQHQFGVLPQKFNFDRTWTYKIPGNSIIPPASTLYFDMATNYTNGFGQPLQSNIRGAIKDLVTIYDHRATLDEVSYLPFASTSPQIGFLFKPFEDQRAWYDANYPAEGNNSFTRTKEILDNGRHYVKTFDAGKSFTGSGRGQLVSVEVNAGDIHKFTMFAYSSGTYPVMQGYYDAGQLIVNRIDGEHGTVSYRYTNKAGQLICTRAEGGTESSGRILTTYYVYDDLGRLTWTITPKAFENLQGMNWTPFPNTIPVYDGLCFHRSYNKYGEVVEKRTPGRGTDLTVYDRKQRPVLTQSPTLKESGRWFFQIHDSRDRVVLDGYVTSPRTRYQWDDLLNNLATPTTGSIEDFLINGFKGNYPTAISNCEVNTYNYYDTYNLGGSFPYNRTFSTDYTGRYSTLPEAIMPKPFLFANGRITANKTRVVGGGGMNEWIYSVMFYDQKGLLIQSQTLNPFNTSNWDVTTQQYNFDGSLNTIVQDQYGIPGSKKPQTLMVLRNRTLAAPNGKRTEVTLQLDSKPVVVLSSVTFDDLGRPREKSMGNGIEVQKYDYNIRGQLTGINADHLTNINYPASTFGCKLSYDYGFEKARYDGNIAGITWRGAGNGANQRAYGYDYDKAGRLTGADFREESGPLRTWQKNLHDYSVGSISYDANGNMLTMKQRGVLHGPIDMDDLTYYYKTNSNTLDRVEDAIGNNGLNDFVNNSVGVTDYTYDRNGNLKSDLNKGIQSITYTETDQPQKVTSIANGGISNIYTASGTLLQKTISHSAVPEVYRYWGPFVYKNNELEYILHSEGRIRYDTVANDFLYDFFVKDHLGNVRTVVQREGGSIRDFRATHEYASARTEQLIFDGLERRAPKPGGGLGEDMMAAELVGSDPEARVGTSLLLKVMAGDKFKAQVTAYYDGENFNPGQDGLNGETMAGSLLGVLTGGMTDLGNEAGGTEFLNSMLSGDGFVNAYNELKNQVTDPNFPRAYLNYVLFDEEMNLVPGQSGVVQMGQANNGNWAELEMVNEIVADHNGYLLTYISSEDQHLKAYFDNLLVTYVRGKLLEEQHYYPHGLVVQNGVNNPLANKYLYQGKEMQKEAGLALYDFHARQYDPQIGRFWGIDPMDEFPSGYIGMGNDPVNLIDPSGMQTNEHFGSTDDPNYMIRRPSMLTDLGPEDAYYQFLTRSPFRGAGFGGSFSGAAQDYKGFQLAASTDNWLYARTTGFGPNYRAFHYSYGTGDDVSGFVLHSKTWYISNTQVNNGAMAGGAVAIGLGTGGGVGLSMAAQAAAPIALGVMAIYSYEKLARNASKKVYATYIKTHPNGSVYVGRTSGTGTAEEAVRNRDRAHIRLKSLGYSPARLDRFAIGLDDHSGLMDARISSGISAYSIIRGREQQMYDYYRLSGVNIGNRVRPVGQLNPLGPMYHYLSSAYFGQVAPYTGFIKFRR
jgi:RHS repeat-associated protein